jgi:hypothetical protein
MNLGLSIFSNVVLGFILLNLNIGNKMGAVEMTVHPDRENVRFLLLNGKIVDCAIKDVSLTKEMTTRITLNVKLDKIA